MREENNELRCLSVVVPSFNGFAAFWFILRFNLFCSLESSFREYVDLGRGFVSQARSCAPATVVEAETSLEEH